MPTVSGEETDKVVDNEPTRRKILSLKSPLAAAKAAMSWKCKPCGSDLEIDPGLADAEVVRCPSCRAKLGKAGQFRSDGPEAQCIRARRSASQTPKPLPMAGDIRLSLSRRTSPSALTVVTRRNRTASDHSARGAVQTISGRAE